MIEWIEEGIAAVVALVGIYATLRKLQLQRMEVENAVAAQVRAEQAAEEEKRKAFVAEQEMRFQVHATDFSAFLSDWQGIAAEMSHLIAESPIDRILIFKAWNGSEDPKWTTAVYQMREVGQHPVQYVHFALDPDYIDKLRETVARGTLSFNVAEQRKSFIKQVYDSEGVKSSLWAYIDTKPVPGTESAAIAYMSFSSHEADAIDNDTEVKCMLLVNRIRALSSSFDHRV